MATRKGTGRGNGGTRDLLAHRMLTLEREVGATNARLDVTNIRLEHLERLTEQVVDALHGLTAAVQELRLDHARVDRLEARVDRLERPA